jgi:hypothetical protein
MRAARQALGSKAPSASATTAGESSRVASPTYSSTARYPGISVGHERLNVHRRRQDRRDSGGIMKEKHPFDLVSLVFGALFVVLALPVLLTDTPLSIDPRWVWPVAVIVLGALVAGSGLRRQDDTDETPIES